MTNGRRSEFDLDALRQDDFDWATALALALAGKLSYQNRGAVEETARTVWGFERVTFLEAGNTQAFYAEAPGIGLLAFRGTESLGDWLGNIDISRADSPFGEGVLHGGFFDGYMAIRSQVLAVMGAADPAPGHRLWLTGHSLGGALATIAAADFLHAGRAFAGVHTHGQPRVGNGDFRDDFDPRARARFFRFRNDDDIVPRVPPGWKHVGQFIHFDKNGNPRDAKGMEGAIEGSAAEEPSLTEQEFEAVQAEIHRIQAALMATEAAGSEAEMARRLDTSMEGIIPGVSDHNIDHYIAAIRKQLPQPSVDAALSQERSAREMAFAGEAVRGDGADAPPVPVLIRLATPQWQPPAGVTVNSRIGTYVSALVPGDLIDDLEADPAVQAVEPSREAATEELTTSVPFVKANVIHGPSLGEHGDAALVGVVDNGIDVRHDTFTDAAGNTRILAVWDQTDNAGGPSPHGVDSAAFQPDYGSVYLAADIADMRDGVRPVPQALKNAISPHGTHVTSIAAGRQVGGCPAGMAPEAGIVVVVSSMQDFEQPGDTQSIGYSVSHMDALHFLIQLARGGNAILTDARPIAINVSQGMNAGAHDGTSLLESVFDTATGKGRDPGVAIVKSAGNERGHGGHARLRAAPNFIVDVSWSSKNFSAFQRPRDYIEAWWDSADDLAFVLTDPDGNTSRTVSRSDPDITDTLGGNQCQLVLTPLHRDNGQSRLAITILPDPDPIQEGDWILSIHGQHVSSGKGIVDVWVERAWRRAVAFKPAEPNGTLSIPGTAETVITVGACGSHEPVRLPSFSSYGPTRTDGPKPDICAPGIDVLAAEGGTPDHQATMTMSGTSMAAPHVAGALALAMSRRHKNDPANQFNAQQLRHALNRTARDRVGFHHEGRGWGVLDVEALFNFLNP